jgi:hypothetical protein
MTGPFIFIATNRLKQGKLNSEQKRLPDLIDFIQANEPRLIAFNEYANEEGTEVAVVQVHPDADSMVFHMELIAERAASAYADTIDATTNIQVFGTPGGTVTDMLRRQAGASVPLRIKPHHLGGFTR